MSIQNYIYKEFIKILSSNIESYLFIVYLLLLNVSLHVA